jgi:uncharacterized protein (DUF305 family)
VAVYPLEQRVVEQSALGQLDHRVQQHARGKRPLERARATDRRHKLPGLFGMTALAGGLVYLLWRQARRPPSQDRLHHASAAMRPQRQFRPRTLARMGKILFEPSAITMGLITSTYSTLVASLGARLLSREATLDWMVVSTIPGRVGMLTAKPNARNMSLGIAMHQSADFGWDLVFFGALGRWTRRLKPQVLAALALPWAAVTSAVEYFLVLPVWRPLFTAQQPYWVGIAVHSATALAYPLYPLVRRRISGRQQPGETFARRWAAGMAGTLGILGVLHLMQRRGRALRLKGIETAHDRMFLRHMIHHHRLGLRLSKDAAYKGAQEDLRLLGNLMTADHAGELRIMREWWDSWMGEELTELTAQEWTDMAGMPPLVEVETVEALDGLAFDKAFLPLMIDHHLGAIAMSERAQKHARDFRSRILARSIIHAQKGQIAIMQNLLDDAHGGRPVQA